MELVVTVSMDNEDVLKLAEYGAMLIDLKDAEGKRLDINLDSWLKNVVANEVKRLASVAYNKKEDLVERYKVIAEQIKQEIEE